MDRSSSIVFPLAASLVIHVLIMMWMLATGLGNRSPPAKPPFQVEIVSRPPAQQAPPAPAAKAARPAEPQTEAQPQPEAPTAAPRVPKQQFVEAQGEQKPPDEATRFLAERDSRAPEQMVRRGEGGSEDRPPDGDVMPATKSSRRAESESRSTDPSEDRQEAGAKKLAERRAARETRAERAAPSGAPPRARELPGLDALFSRPSEVMAQAAKDEEAAEAQGSDGSRDPDLASLNRPDLWMNPGSRGTLDYLPDVRHGQFTLLNAKADAFAPFVRRVGLRVFQAFSMEFKRAILSRTVPNGQERIEVEAVMSPNGRRLRIYLRARNGGLSSERQLLGVLNDRTFFDENPPAAAVAEDGNIHFMFSLDASVWMTQDPRSGRSAPGARWVFGAGLL